MNNKKTYYGQNKKKLKKEERIHSVNGKVKAKEYNKNKKKKGCKNKHEIVTKKFRRKTHKKEYKRNWNENMSGEDKLKTKRIWKKLSQCKKNSIKKFIFVL